MLLLKNQEGVDWNVKLAAPLYTDESSIIKPSYNLNSADAFVFGRIKILASAC